MLAVAQAGAGRESTPGHVESRCVPFRHRCALPPDTWADPRDMPPDLRLSSNSRGARTEAAESRPRADLPATTRPRLSSARSSIAWPPLQCGLGVPLREHATAPTHSKAAPFRSSRLVAPRAGRAPIHAVSFRHADRLAKSGGIPRVARTVRPAERVGTSDTWTRADAPKSRTSRDGDPSHANALKCDGALALSPHAAGGGGNAVA